MPPVDAAGRYVPSVSKGVMGRKQELREKTVWRSDPHTLVKHLIYRHYLDCWMPKILQKFPTATIVDAFAGPGCTKTVRSGPRC